MLNSVAVLEVSSLSSTLGSPGRLFTFTPNHLKNNQSCISVREMKYQIATGVSLSLRRL